MFRADELLEALTALRVAVEHLAVLTDEAGRPGVGTGRVIPNRIERVAAAVFQVWVANTSASARSLKAQGVSNAARENTIDPLNVHALQRMVHLITHAHAALSAPGGVASEVALWRERGWGWTAALATEAAAWWNLSAALVGIPPHAPSTRWTLLLSEARKTARVAQDAERAARSAAPSLKLSRVV